jgi:hypothetical protein
LAEIIGAADDRKLQIGATEILRQCLDRYVFPLAALTPFGVIPYGVFRDNLTEGDHYRPWRDGYYCRFFMPECHPQRISIGLSGHLTSWAHALALTGKLLNDPKCLDLAWRQLQWLLGCNPFNSSMVSGVGYNNPMPHSRLMGTYPGGFCAGIIGSPEDQPLLDLEADAQWNTTEYWLAPLSNALMALCILNPTDSPVSRKLGQRDQPAKMAG